MKGSLAKLARQTGAYAVGNILFKVAGFLLAFFYLDPEYLSQAAYGRLAVLEATSKVAIPLFALGLANGLLKFWADPAHREEQGALSFTALIGTLGAAVAGLVLFVVLAEPLADVLLGDQKMAHLVRLLALYIGLKILATTPTALIRIHERVWLHVLAIFAEMFVLVGGVYFFLVVLQRGLLGVLEAYVLSAGLSTLLLTGGMLYYVPWRFRPGFLSRLARFGAPLAAAGLATMLLSLGDRYILKWLANLEIVAVYDWSARLGSILFLLLVSSFSMAFNVLGVKELGADPSQAELHRQSFRHFSLWTGWAALGLSILSYDVTRIVSPNPAFLEAESLVLPIALGFFFYGIYYLMANILYIGGKTGTIALNIVLAVILNVVLNLALIPYFGAMGAALATVLSYLGLVVLTARVTRSQTNTRFPWGALAKVIVVVLVLYALAHISLDWSVTARLVWRMALIVAYIPVVVALGLYRWDEVTLFYRTLRK